MKYIFIVLLGMCMIHDLRSKKIPGPLIWICIWLSMGYRGYCILTGNANIADCLMNVIPGVLLLAFSYSSKQVGNGDGLLVIATGLFLEGKEIMEVLFMAFLFAAVVAMVYLLIKQESQNNRIPFVPFLFIAVLFQLKGGT